MARRFSTCSHPHRATSAPARRWRTVWARGSKGFEHSLPHSLGKVAPPPRGRAGWGRVSKLYVVATPIGNLEDLSARALRVLGEVSAIAAEDTRGTSRLLARHGIRKPMITDRRPVDRPGLPRALSALDHGDVAPVRDAGAPPLADPGDAPVHPARAGGRQAVPIP